MGQDTNVKKFCPSCGENVDTYIVNRGGIIGGGGTVSASERHEDECCILCGMIVEEIHHNEITPAESILVADDSTMIRDLLSDLISHEKLAKDVAGCGHGAEFITVFTGKALAKEPFSLVVLDVAMPVLNGINAAIAMRAIEKALKIKPTPILFFTAQKCDENFKKVMAYCKPALYVNKGVSSMPDLLASRIGQVVKRLLGNHHPAS